MFLPNIVAFTWPEPRNTKNINRYVYQMSERITTIQRAYDDTDEKKKNNCIFFKLCDVLTVKPFHAWNVVSNPEIATAIILMRKSWGWCANGRQYTIRRIGNEVQMRQWTRMRWADFCRCSQISVHFGTVILVEEFKALHSWHSYDAQKWR